MNSEHSEQEMTTEKIAIVTRFNATVMSRHISSIKLHFFNDCSLMM